MQVQCLKEKLVPADVTRMVLWLASDDSRMCTAQLWVVDAGRCNPSLRGAQRRSNLGRQCALVTEIAS